MPRAMTRIFSSKSGPAFKQTPSTNAGCPPVMTRTQQHSLQSEASLLPYRFP